MSTDKHIDRICIIITVFAILTAVLFMNGEKLGIERIVDADAEKYSDLDQFTANDQDGEWDTAGATVITLSGESAAVSGNGAYAVNGSVVITNAGRYVVSGTLTDGNISIDAYISSKVWLLLDGVDITSSDNAAIRVEEADKVFLTLADGSENLGRTQQRAGMHVVTTGVHHARVLRGKGQPGAFCKGQRVVVGTQPHAIAVRVLPSANHCHHARLADARAGFQSHLPQPLGHESHCAELLLAQLRMPVQMAPPPNHLVAILV